MAKQTWHVTIHDKHTGQPMYLEASSERALDTKILKQTNLWQKQELSRLYTEMENQAKITIEGFNQYIEALRHIVTWKFSDLGINNFYRQEPAIDYPDFVCSANKPTLEDVFKQQNVPKENKLVEKFLRKIQVNRQQKEVYANDFFNKKLDDFEALKKNELSKYSEKKSLTELNRILSNKRNYDQLKQFMECNKAEVENFINETLKKLTYVEAFRDDMKNNDSDYKPESKLLIVSRKLSSRNKLPDFSSYKFDKKSNKLEKVKWNIKELQALYEDVIFQITLKTIRDLFDLTPKEVINTIAFNGWVDYIDDSTGKMVTSCIISLEVDRDSFMDINLELIDYKNCIKFLKGIFHIGMTSLSPIRPILNIDRGDTRFIESKDVSDILYDGFNLAIMDWEDFEYLIRQLFGKIFSFGDSEVKITQASRDGGVDAIAFDPDPIRGGKFIIQAKRYNILVPVSAVRDLYGTMIHEGATRGILVTTSDFGGDSFKFAKDKPITLLNGQELLGLLNQHGFNNVKIMLNKKKEHSELKIR